MGRTPTTKAPPKHLKADTKRWFTSVCEDYDLEPHHEKLLIMACETWDRSRECQTLLKKEGLAIIDRFGQQKPHPMLAIERDFRVLFARLVRELGLDNDEPSEDEVRPPRVVGVNRAS